MGFGDILPRVRSIGRVPRLAPFRQQLTFWKFRRLNLRGRYDFFFIVGDWAMSAAVNNFPNMWYAHSPLNELWAYRDFVLTQLLKGWQKLPFRIWTWFNRKLTLQYARSVGVWVANSKNTAARIKKFYGREATVVNPPIPTEDYPKRPTGDYWLSVNRLAVAKRIEIQMEAFRKLPSARLVVIGSYEERVPQFEGYKKYLEKIKPPNVELRHWVEDKELKELYAGCRGFVTTSRDEDFGMSAVEAMAAGKPVAAPAEGGYPESVVDGKTGRLIENIDAEKLAQAVREIEAELARDPSAYAEACRARAEDFDTKKFIGKIRLLLSRYP
jgi:glycosyltransferase involved in cell wall biosynthesis